MHYLCTVVIKGREDGLRKVKRDSKQNYIHIRNYRKDYKNKISWRSQMTVAMYATIGCL